MPKISGQRLAKLKIRLLPICSPINISKENTKISITVDEVRTAMRSMKIGKSDGKCVLMSDHIINCGHCLNVYLSMLFNCMVMHGVSAAS